MTPATPGTPALPSPLRGALLDLDGTLVDTESLHLASTNVVLQEYGQRLELPDFLPFVGSAEEPFWEALRERFALTAPAGELAVRRETRFLELLHSARIVPLPGVRALLGRLEMYGIPVAVASSSTRREIEATLRGADLLDRVQAFCSGHDDVAAGKPRPDVYLAAAAAIGVEPEQCFAVEDSATGVAAARAAGAFVVAVPCLSHPDPDLGAAHLLLDSLLDLLPPLERTVAKPLGEGASGVPDG